MMILEGLRPWMLQRISAVIIAAWLGYATVCLGMMDSPDYTAWKNWVAVPYNSLFLGLFVLAILLHAWIGMRDIILDYVHHLLVRIIVLTAIQVILLICGLWSLRILLVPLAG